MSKPKKNFTVWFRVGKDFKETIEAEDVHDAQRKWTARYTETSISYWKQMADDLDVVIYDIADGEYTRLQYCVCSYAEWPDES